MSISTSARSKPLNFSFNASFEVCSLIFEMSFCKDEVDYVFNDCCWLYHNGTKGFYNFTAPEQQDCFCIAPFAADQDIAGPGVSRLQHSDMQKLMQSFEGALCVHSDWMDYVPGRSNWDVFHSIEIGLQTSSRKR